MVQLAHSLFASPLRLFPGRASAVLLLSVSSLKPPLSLLGRRRDCDDIPTIASRVGFVGFPKTRTRRRVFRQEERTLATVAEGTATVSESMITKMIYRVKHTQLTDPVGAVVGCELLTRKGSPPNRRASTAGAASRIHAKQPGTLHAALR